MCICRREFAEGRGAGWSGGSPPSGPAGAELTLARELSEGLPRKASTRIVGPVTRVFPKPLIEAHPWRTSSALFDHRGRGKLRKHFGQTTLGSAPSGVFSSRLPRPRDRVIETTLTPVFCSPALTSVRPLPRPAAVAPVRYQSLRAPRPDHPGPSAPLGYALCRMSRAASLSFRPPETIQRG